MKKLKRSVRMKNVTTKLQGFSANISIKSQSPLDYMTDEQLK